jgi:hypothetical protein
MGIENRIITGNQFASNLQTSGISSISTPNTNVNKFSARVVSIIDYTNYIIEFEPIKDNVGISAYYNPNVITQQATPKNNQLISIPDINSIVTITVEPGLDVNKKLGGGMSYYWEIPTNIQNTRNDNIGPKNKPKPNKNTKTVLSYKQSVIGIPNQNG